MVGTFAAGWLVLPIRAALNQHQVVRSDETVKRLSLKPVHYLASSPKALIHFDSFEAAPWQKFNVGWFRMLLAAIGIAYGLLYGVRRRWVVFLLLIGCFAFLFSLGLYLELWGWRPWVTLCNTLPGFAQVRSVFRFAWFVQLAIVLLAVEGVSALLDFHQRRFAETWKKTAWAILVFVPGALLAGEVWPETPRRGSVPDLDRKTEWIPFLRENRAQDDPWPACRLPREPAFAIMN